MGNRYQIDHDDNESLFSSESALPAVIAIREGKTGENRQGKFLCAKGSWNDQNRPTTSEVTVLFALIQVTYNN